MEAALIPVQLTGIFHKGQHRLGICFANYGSINSPLRKAGALWSQTHKCWHVPLQKKYFDQLMQVLQPVASIDRSKLDQYLAAMQPVPNQVQNLQKTEAAKPAPTQPFREATAATLYKENEAALASARQALILKGYSTSTPFFEVLAKRTSKLK